MGQFSQFTKAHDCKKVSLIPAAAEPHLQAARSGSQVLCPRHVLPHIESYHPHSLNPFTMTWRMAFPVLEFSAILPICVFT